MKKMLLMLLTLGIGQLNAQNVKESEVPAAAKTKFQSLYPNAKNVQWEKEGADYEAEFVENKTETSVVITATGTLVQTEVEISQLMLPSGINAYAQKNLPGKKITEAVKITSANGVITYEAEIGGDDYIFDTEGNFIRKEIEEKEAGDEKDDD
ncbi:MAG TPA: PepSY-like domain-containing protein [Bacteroidia bacterium]|nr:PepSY-like domain-containing protein [Bacteroidia bacterium]